MANLAELQKAAATLPARLLDATAGLVRMSTESPGSDGLTVTTQRRPFQVMDSMVALGPAATLTADSSTMVGTRHSCKLKPPCAYSLPAMKLEMPGT